MPSSFDIRVVSWSEQREALRAIRETVFIIEQEVSREEEWDDRDQEATHFLLSVANEPVACGRLLADGKVGRMAVLAEYRGSGLGLELLKAIVEHARSTGLSRLYLHAQQYAEPFYRKAGFTPAGEPFEEAGIPHIGMELTLDYTGVDQFVGGVHYPQPFGQLAVELCRTASRYVDILSPKLDHAVFDDSDLNRVLSRLARSSAQSRVRILIADSRSIVARGHSLLQLARRIPSSIRIQKLAEHPDWNGETVLTRDLNGVLFTPSLDSREGFYEPDSRASTKQHLELFDELWRYSQQDSELRSLSL